MVPYGVNFTAHKRNLGKGNVFTSVCHSVHGGKGSYGVFTVSLRDWDWDRHRDRDREESMLINRNIFRT